MSRIGRMPVPKPDNVTVDIRGTRVAVKGPRGELSREFHPDMIIQLQDGQIVDRISQEVGNKC